jgi:hypothetical protein
MGLMDYKARLYSPYLNQWTQPDSIVPDPTNPQSLNRYSYVLNAPLRFTDPTGHTQYVDPKVTCDLDCWRALHRDDDSGGNDCKICESLLDAINDGLQSVFGGHSYWAPQGLVCLPVPWIINCTPEETKAYLAGNQYPGQLPSRPVQSGGRYNVFPEKFGDTNLLGRWFPGSGAIHVEFEENKISNFTDVPHIFYFGYVDRSSYNALGMTFVTTYGEGYNDGFEVGGHTVPGWVIDQANDIVGPIAFEALNVQMIIYTTWIETKQWLNGTQQP